MEVFWAYRPHVRLQSDDVCGQLAEGLGSALPKRRDTSGGKVTRERLGDSELGVRVRVRSRGRVACVQNGLAGSFREY